VLIGVHVATATREWSLGMASLTDGLLFTRDLRFRVSVGGQLLEPVVNGETWRLWTSVLLHADAIHLVVNAIALLALGRMLEPWLGARRLLAWFSFGGFSGSVASYLGEVPQSDGASGGAFALLGAAAVFGWLDRARLEPDDRRLLGPVMWGFLALNLVLSVALPFIDALAHFGGLAAGVLLALAIRRQRHWSIAGIEVCWLLSFAIVCAIGWGMNW
jgi:rhomboid protease GluP